MSRLAVTAAGLCPLALLAFDFASNGLGANPVEEITHRTGGWTLRMLLLCIAVTPISRTLGWNGLDPHRRTLGLLSFFYALLHVTTYLTLDLELRWGDLVGEVLERPHIAAGVTSFLLMLPLALTSSPSCKRLLGRFWARLHTLVYAAVVAGVVHFLWLVKADLAEPIAYAGVAAALLLTRVRWWFLRNATQCATLPRSFRSAARTPEQTVRSLSETWTRNRRWRR